MKIFKKAMESSKLGVETTIEILEKYVKKRIK